MPRIDEHPDIVTLDFRLPDMRGDALLEKVRSINEHIAVIMISEQEEIETAVELLRKGAYDYLVKNDEIRDRLLHTVRHIEEHRALKSEVTRLRSQIVGEYDFAKTVIGESEAMKKVFALLQKAVQVDITIGLFGETGTGKEVFAKAVHYNSNRSNKNFVPVKYFRHPLPN